MRYPILGQQQPLPNQTIRSGRLFRPVFGLRGEQGRPGLRHLVSIDLGEREDQESSGARRLGTSQRLDWSTALA
jgi:hypothetical protein